jgi:YD repeat-containing protein
VNCRGCGTEVEDNPNLAAVNQAVDEVLQASVEDARQRGGVCPLCGHSHYVPFYNRDTFRTALLLGVWVLLGLILATTYYTRSPIRSSLAQDALARARQDSRVRMALGSPIRSGLLATGGIESDETGWSEAKLSIPLRGPKASGTLQIVAGRGEGPWVVSVLEVWVEQEAQPINLLRGRVEVLAEQGYVSIHTQPAVTPILLASIAAPPESDGSYPVIRISADSQSNRILQLAKSFASRQPHFLNQPENTYEVDLRSGTFVLRRTDLFVQDSIPLVFTRTYHGWGPPNWGRDGNWAFASGSNHPAFGPGSSHSYDICPMGTRNPYTFQELYMADGNFIFFNRISQGTSYADAWYEHTDTSSEFYKARFWWNGNGWTLRLQDGTIYQFPESYNGTNLAQGAPFEMRDPQGRRVQIVRDTNRNLRRLVSPNARSISLDYDDAGRVRQAHDDNGHSVDYSYDSEGRLFLIRENERPAVRYRFDPNQPDKIAAIEDGDGNVLLRNSYFEDGRISAQISADGSEYRYHYELDAQGRVALAMVTAPDRTTRSFCFRNGVPTVQK